MRKLNLKTKTIINLMKTVKQLLLCLAVVNATGCAAVFIPGKQKVTINTNKANSTVYVNNEEVGKGETVTAKVKKDGAKQVVVQTPGYKDAYYVLVQDRKHPAWYPLVALDIPLIYGLMVDLQSVPKFWRFTPSNNLTSNYKYVNKTASEKYIQLDAVKLSIADKNKDLRDITGVSHSSNLMDEMNRAERNTLAQEQKQEAKMARKKKKKKLLGEEDEKTIAYDDTKFSETLYKTLKKTGYVDTVNKVFTDHMNTLTLEGVIKKASVFHIEGSGWSDYKKAKVYLTWNIKNAYGETLDSVTNWSYSGDFVYGGEDKGLKMFADAVDNSYLDLKKNKTFIRHLQVDSNFTIKDAVLNINQPKKAVSEVSQASTATVTIKRDDGGHGSGFAISNDGYILTNFHVIAGETVAKQSKLTVVLSDGQESPATIVRFNRMRDIALLKVDKAFEHAFSLSPNKSFKNLMEVYTIGTPKSIELGQSVSLGLISNERKTGNTNLLQLSMSVNSGNSGGPLFEKSGTLQGVVTSKLVGYATEGVGFAIPSYLIPSYLNLSVN
jgi:serine protease Do